MPRRLSTVLIISFVFPASPNNKPKLRDPTGSSLREKKRGATAGTLQRPGILPCHYISQLESLTNYCMRSATEFIATWLVNCVLFSIDYSNFVCVCVCVCVSSWLWVSMS